MKSLGLRVTAPPVSCPEGLNGGGGGGLVGGGGPHVGCRLKFHYFVGCRSKFSTFVGCR